MQRRFVLIAIASALVLSAFPAAGSATFIPGPNGKIAFTSGRANSNVPMPADNDDSQARIWVVDSLSGTPVQVTTQPSGQHRHPNWSPDHSKIVYAVGAAPEFALWIVDLKTKLQTEFVKKTTMQDRPSWSPDGSRIAFGSNGNLYVKNVSDTNVNSYGTLLTNTAGVTEERPVWSHDGNSLYYNREDSAKPLEKRNIYKKSPVTLAGAETPITSGNEDDWQPALSPDGQRLCFLRGPMSSEATIWTINVNGTGGALFSEHSLNCVWSPDGTRILFTEKAFSEGQLASRNINKGGFSFVSFNVEKHFDGNSDWATNFTPTCENKSASVGVNGFTSIPLSCTDPDAGFGAAAPAPDPLGDNGMEIASPPKNGNLGSLDNGKVIYTPNKDFKGTDTFTYTGEDDESTSKPATVTIQVADPPTGGGGDKTAPSISELAVTKKKWRLGKGLASISKSPVGTTISFTLSEAASATLSFQRVKKKNGKTRYVDAGSLKALSAKVGKNRVRFQGRLTKTRSLALGKYRVVVAAKDAAGNQSQRNGPTFTIVAE